MTWSKERDEIFCRVSNATPEERDRMFAELKEKLAEDDERFRTNLALIVGCISWGGVLLLEWLR